MGCRYKISKVVAVYTFCATILLLISPVLADSWLSSYGYRIPIDISNTAGSLSNYQIPLIINTQAPISTGKMRSFCEDIRFTNSDGSSELKYWIESGCGTTTTKIWVKVPSIGSSKKIYMYYGNPSANSVSSGQDTMELFDLFSSASCTPINHNPDHGGPTWNSGGYFDLHSTVNGNGRCHYSYNPGDGFYVKFDFWIGGGTGADALWFAAYNDGDAWHEDGANDGYHYTFDEYGNGGGTGLIGWTDCHGPVAQSCHNNAPTIASYSTSSLGNSVWHSTEILNYQSKSKVIYYSTIGGSATTAIDWTTDSTPIDRDGTWFGFGARTGGMNNYHRVRNFFVAKYVTPEPTFSVGSEQSLESTPPQVSVTSAPISWTNTNDDASIICDDSNTGNSGCDSSSYRYYKIAYSNTAPSCSSYNYNTQYTTSPTVSSHSWVCGAAKDGHGNVGYSSPIEFTVDTQHPTASLSGMTSWQNTNAVASASCTDIAPGSGCDTSSYRYKYVSGNTCPNDYSQYTDSATITSYQKVCAAVKDIAGNIDVTDASVEFKVDKDPPVAGVTGAPATWQNTPATATATCSDSGGAGCNSDSYRLRIYSSNPGTCSTNYDEYSSPSSQSIADYRWVCSAVKDNAGNVDFSDPVEFRVDSQGPTVDISGMPTVWQNTDATATTTCTDTGPSGCDSLTYQQIHYYSSVSSCPTTYSSYSLSSPKTITNHTWVCGAAKDSSGNIGYSSTPREFKVDKYAPVSTANHDHPAHWHTTDQLVTITCSDIIGMDPYSGCQSQEYCIQTDGMPPCTLQPYGGQNLNISENGVNTIYYRAKDHAGNIETTKTATIKIDKDGPSVTYQTNPSPANGANGWFITAPVTVTLTCSDVVSGCAVINYCNTTASSCNRVSHPVSPPSYSITFYLSQQGDNLVNFSATDGAGLESGSYIEYVKIDTQNPMVPVTVTTASPPLRAGSGWFTDDVNVSMQCTDPTPGSGCWIFEWCENNSCTNTTVTATNNPLWKLFSLTNIYNLNLSVYDYAGRKTTHNEVVKLDVDPPTINDHYFHNGSVSTIPTGPHGNTTDRYRRLYTIGVFADQVQGSGFYKTAESKIFFQNDTFFKNLTLSDQNGNINYSSFLVQGNVTYDWYYGKFYVEDVAGWKTESFALNNLMNITKIEIEGNTTAASVAGDVMSVDTSNVILETGNEGTIFVTLNNYLNTYNPVTVTLATVPSGPPMQNWVWFTKHKYSPLNRTTVTADLGIGDSVTIPVTVLGGVSGVNYIANITANFTEEFVLYKKSVLVQVVDPNRGFFTTTPESYILFSFVTCFVVIFLVLSSQKISDIFK